MKKPANYYCHRTYSNQEIVPQGYEVIEKIGEGTFGQVFKVFDQSTSSIMVLKRSKQEQSQKLINRQSSIMIEMSNSDGFAKVIDRNNKTGCLVMSLLGANLQDIIDQSTLSLVDIKRIAYQCIKRLKELHEKGFVHRDIKPENILMGNLNNPHKVYLIDFGLSGPYKREATRARKMYNGEIGTIKYCSMASHKGEEQFPKDDLQSLGYLLAYLALKKLPWSGLPKDMESHQKYQLIGKMKENVEIDQLCLGIGCLKKYFKAVKSLKLGQAINYQMLMQYFWIECKEVYCYSFCKDSCMSRLKKVNQNSQEEQTGVNVQFIQKSIVKKSEAL